jgi:hypothetical protein
MDTKNKRNPTERLPDWRVTLPLAHAAPRCGAKTRASTPCRAAAMNNGRCRLHGGASTGPRTAEGVERIRAAQTKHGAYGAKARELRALIKALKASSRGVAEKF